MTPPISLRALLEVEARATPGPWTEDWYEPGDYEAPVDKANREISVTARNAVKPLCEALQEAIAALEEIRDADPMPYRPAHVTADTALAKIRLKVVP